MRPVDTILETLAQIADNNNQLPNEWLEEVVDYEAGNMGLTKVDIVLILHVLQKSAPCKFLEIGAGYSTSRFFLKNLNGLSVSLEDNEEWVETVSSKLDGGTGVVIRYSNQSVQSANTLPSLHHWKANARRLAGFAVSDLPSKDYRLLQKRVLIPDWLWTITFDIILVDGPFGGSLDAAGRSGTIMLASKLAGPSTVTFIDDVGQRPYELKNVETFFAGRYLHMSPSQRLIIAI